MLKSVGVSIWSWIGGYLLAFSGIRHNPRSLSESEPLCPPLAVTLTSPSGIFYHCKETMSFFRFCFIILPVALSCWVLSASWIFNLPSKSSSALTSKPPTVFIQYCLHFADNTTSPSMFEMAKTLLPFQFLALIHSPCVQWIQMIPFGHIPCIIITLCGSFTLQPVFVHFSSHCSSWLLCNFIVLSSIKQNIPTQQSK